MAIRIPRIMGLTQLRVEQEKAPKDQSDFHKARIIKYVVNTWVLNNGLLCNEMMNINSLANYLQCEISDIQNSLMEKTLETKIWDKDKQNEIIASLLGVQVAWLMEDRMEASAQLELMKKSQGDKYIPFISAEVRQTMDLKMKAGQSIQGLIKAFSGGSTTNIFNQFNNNGEDTPQQNTGISKEDALKILYDDQGFTPNGVLTSLESRYDFDSLPEVCAKDQNLGDDDVSQESLDYLANKRAIRVVTDDYKIHREGDEEEFRHSVRRALQVGIDTDNDEEDFESVEELGE